MGQLQGLRGAAEFTRGYPLDGKITTGGTSQLLLPYVPSMSRTYLIIENTSASGNLTLGFGGATATAAVSGGVVTGFTVTNGGFGYTKPPFVQIIGGIGGGLGFPRPEPQSAQASAHAVLTGDAVTSIVVDNGGAGYTAAPFILLINQDSDSTGAFNASATAGFVIAPNGQFVMENSTVLNDQVSIWGATTGQSFAARVVL